MDWLHCNKCFAKPSPGLELVVTSCKHVFCKICLEKGAVTTASCALCKRPFQTATINRNLPKDIQLFFKPAKVVVLEQLKKLQMAAKFQRAQLNNLIGILRKKETDAKALLQKFKAQSIAEFAKLKNDADTMRQRVKQASEDLEKATAECREAQEKLRKLEKSADFLGNIDTSSNTFGLNGSKNLFDLVNSSGNTVDSDLFNNLMNSWTAPSLPSMPSMSFLQSPNLDQGGLSQQSVESIRSIVSNISETVSEFTTPKMLGLPSLPKRRRTPVESNPYMEMWKKTRGGSGLPMQSPQGLGGQPTPRPTSLGAGGTRLTPGNGDKRFTSNGVPAPRSTSQMVHSGQPTPRPMSLGAGGTRLTPGNGDKRFTSNGMPAPRSTSQMVHIGQPTPRPMSLGAGGTRLTPGNGSNRFTPNSGSSRLTPGRVIPPCMSPATSAFHRASNARKSPYFNTRKSPY